MRRLIAGAFAACAVGGCGEILGVTDWEVTDAAQQDGSNSGDSGDASQPQTDGGAKSCKSPRSGAGSIDGVLVLNDFCIDSTEATVASYKVFESDPNSNPSVGQPAECSWNTTYMPPYDPYDGVFPDESNYPQGTIDWCDALAYCTYWGKRLCGNRTDGGAVDLTTLTSFPQASEWYEACTNGTSNAYPYGNTLEAGTCNVGKPTNVYADIQPVTTQTCQGGVAGLFDMVGNLSEWENGCSPGDAGPASDLCNQRGAPLFFSPTDANCQAFGGNWAGARNGDTSPWNGIRCCWDP